VDGWISQARKLQDDIKRSQETAQEIVQQAESGKETTARVQDATSKVSFLYSEMAYNESLVQVVEQIRDISTLLEAVQDAAVRGNVMHALERLEDVGGAFKQLGTFQDIRVVAVLKTRADQLRSAIVEHTTDSWNSLIAIDSTDRHVVLKNTLESMQSAYICTFIANTGSRRNHCRHQHHRRSPRKARVARYLY
jgi:centromere/kinetochore protein ZW10